MKELIDKHLEKYFDVEIEVLPISVIDMDEQLVHLQQEYEILATTGIVKPKIDAFTFQWNISSMEMPKKYWTT